MRHCFNSEVVKKRVTLRSHRGRRGNRVANRRVGMFSCCDLWAYHWPCAFYLPPDIQSTFAYLFLTLPYTSFHLFPFPSSSSDASPFLLISLLFISRSLHPSAQLSVFSPSSPSISFQSATLTLPSRSRKPVGLIWLIGSMADAWQMPGGQMAQWRQTCLSSEES